MCNVEDSAGCLLGIVFEVNRKVEQFNSGWNANGPDTSGIVVLSPYQRN